jgi:glycosyltransferase involved in cell wall biosynthesis
MKILVVCQHYWPEPYPLPDICEELVRRGNEVHVITDVPNYPMGEIYPGYEHHLNRLEEHNGVRITRTFTIARRHNAVFRVLNYYSFALSSSICARYLKEEYDVVFANQSSPVMMSSAAFVYAKKHHKKTVMYCMDLWPACLAAGGIKEDSFIYNHYGKVSAKIYNKPDLILITSKMFHDYLIQKHRVDENKIVYFPQYASQQFENMRKQTVCKKDTVDLMFAGNIGAAQNLDTVIEAAEILREEKELRWHIIGDGSELEALKKLTGEKKLTNVIFYGRKDSAEMPKYYAMADAMLVTLTADPYISMTLPGKVQSYMAAGKPIIAAGNGEIPRVLSEANCGICSQAGNAQELAKAVHKFLKCTNKQQLSDNAKSYYDKHFSRNRFMNELEKTLQKYAG